MFMTQGGEAHRGRRADEDRDYPIYNERSAS